MNPAAAGAAETLPPGGDPVLAVLRASSPASTTCDVAGGGDGRP